MQVPVPQFVGDGKPFTTADCRRFDRRNRAVAESHQRCFATVEGLDSISTPPSIAIASTSRSLGSLMPNCAISASARSPGVMIYR